MMKKILTLVILFFVCVSLFAQKIDYELQQEMSQRADNEKINVFVIMTPQYDRSTLTRGASFYSDRKDRQTYVVNELKSFAETTQSDIRKSLDAMEKNNQTTTPNVLWIANALSFSATKSAIEELAKRKDVSIIGFDKEEYMLFDEDSKPADNTREMTQNITQVRANEVWNFGYTGEGVIVAVVDSGVNYNHLDLADHLWDGGTEFPNHGWDFVNNDNDPMDDNGHGTHCAGTVCGDGTAGSQTGMAPDASLMIVKCLNSAGRGSTSNCVNSMQWAVEHGCDIISMSLGAATSDVSTRTLYRNTCVAVLDAGVVASIAAGNDGDDLDTYPIPYNVGVPGGCPPPYIDPRQAVNAGGLSCSVCIGAVDYNDNPAYFTSHGPVTWADTGFGDYSYSSNSGVEFGLIRPDVCAPGVSIKSANYTNTSGYCYKSGTSMATPCVAGCMALILSKDHNVTPAEMCKLLEETAVPLSESKSNLTGCGRVDVMAAISNMASGTLKLDSFTINDSQGNNDNMLNPGETVTLNLLLNNDSDFAVDNASLELTTESDYISISNNVKDLPHFNAHQTIAVDNAFSFSLDEGIIPGNVIAFTAAVKINDETVGVIPFSITVYGYLLHYKEIAFLNDSNGNGSLEPGETADIRVFVENGGNVQANSLVGTLTTDYEYLTINESVKSYGDMASGDLRYADYSVSLSNSAPQNYSFDLLLTMVDNHNRQTQLAFDHEKYAINATINIEGAGIITGTGFYDRGATCVLTATPNTGYLFENWSVNNVMEYTKMSYTFEATANVDYVANLIQFNGVYLGSGEEYDTGLPGATSAINKYSLSQQIYTVDEIGQTGFIRSISFYNDGYYQPSNYSIYLKNTTKTAFQSTTDWETVSASDMVFSAKFGFTVGEWIKLEFDKLFKYDGNSNLMVVVDDNSGQQNPVFGRAYKGNGYQTIYVSSYTDDIDPLNVSGLSGIRKPTKNQIILEIIDANTTYTVSAEPNIIVGGTITGGGTYYINTSCTLTATPNSGYEFLNWTKDGKVVSTESSYTFNVLNDCNIIANFYSNEPIPFADNKVKELCVNNWDTNGDGELSYIEAAVVTDLGQVFRSKNTIVSFDELQYFTGLNAIGDYSFYYCRVLTSLIIPDNVVEIGNNAFYDCEALASLDIPNSVETIANGAFHGCVSLTSLYIPASVISIRPTAFGHNNLEQIIVDPDNTVYDSRNSCNAIVETATNEMIVGCKNTVFPSTVTSIGSYAFYQCEGFTTIEIPSTITEISYNAFVQTSIEQIIVDPDNTTYDSRDNCNAIIHTATNELVVGCKNTVIPNTVTKIGEYAFYYCKGLTSIDIPNSVKIIGDDAFNSCTDLTNVSISDQVLQIGYSAFEYCSNIESMNVYAELPPLTMGNYVFYGINKSIPVTVYCESIDSYISAPLWSDFINYNSFENDCQQEITVSVNIAEGGTANGGGLYNTGDTCNLVATPNEGYLFINWTKNGEIVSCAASYSFNVSLGGEYVANFMELNGIYIGEGEAVNQYLPSYYVYSLSQQLYTADEIGAGTIRGIAFYNAGAEDIRDLTIYIKNTEKQAFNTTYSWSNSSKDWITVTESDMVFSGDVIMNKGIWNFITFDTPFVNDGLSNIVIVVDDNSNSFSYSDYMQGRVFDTDERQALYVASYSSNYDPYNPSSYSGTALMVKNQIIFDIDHPESFPVNVTKDIDVAGTVSGAGTYDYGSTCTLCVTANEGYTFRYWVDNGKILSINKEVSFKVLRPHDITAVFSEDAPIPFADAAVKSICVASWDSRGDGELSYAEAAAVDDLGNAFRNNSTITSFDELQFFTGLNTIGNQAFYYCSKLKSVVLPNSIISIGYRAFYRCSELASLTIPCSVTSLDSYVLGYCSGLTSIAVDATTPPTANSNTFLYIDKNIPVSIPCGSLSAYQDAAYWNEFTNFIGNCDIPISFADPVVKSLCVANWDTNGDGELSYAEAAEVTDLGEVFRGNHTITSFDELQYFTGLTSIAERAFNYSTSLASITLPSTITTIGNHAFYQCYDLLSIDIPSSVTMIEDEVFGNTHNLAHITVDPNNTVYDSRNDCNAIINSTTNALLVGCYNTIIPNSVTTIERYAFRGCSNLTSITLPNSITTIESETFFGCSGLTSITIPSSVSSIGSHLFACCNLAQIVVEQGNTHYDSRENCNAIIDSETNALIVGCKNTVIPNTVTKIASSAFYACDGLTSIVIPQSVTELSDLALYCCMNLGSITLNCLVPPTVGENALGAVDKSIQVYVPCNTSAAYASAIGWNEFTNIQEILCVNIEATANPTIAGIITGGGNYYKGVECTLNAVANEGYLFENWTENGVVVSDNPEYTFTVNEDRTLEANFISTQTTQLSSGWNWWSTYIEMDGFNGLEYLENTVGDLGICIKSQVCAVVNYFPATGESFWFGDDIVIDNENCYMIDVTDDCLVQLDGDKANPADHPIRIKPNWSWIGYIDNVTQSANTAMSDFEPIQEDVIKSKDDAATYWAGYGWYPAINLVPGQGYKYFSNSNEDRYLVYNNASSKSEVAKRQEKFWHYDTHAYANTMTIISVVDIDNEEIAKGDYELAAFVDNECRGSVKLDYFEPLDRYFAVMSIAGNDMEEISFGLADTSNGDVGFSCEQSMTFATDAVVGRLSSPYIISFNHENTDVVVNIYPNPVDRNESFKLDTPKDEIIKEIVITDALGSVVCKNTRGLHVSGIYMVKAICVSGNVYNGKLVVK